LRIGATKDEIEGMNDDIEEILACLRRADTLKLASRQNPNPPKLSETRLEAREMLRLAHELRCGGMASEVKFIDALHPGPP
jgi:hypothetical protein